MSPKEARKQAFIDAALQVGEAVVGGLISGSVSSSAYTGVQTLANNAAYAKTGTTIMDADGGVEALINSANQVAGVSSEDVRNMLTSQIDKVTQNPTARSVGQLYATVQTASNQANAAVNQANTVANQEDVAKSLISKGFTAKKADGIAEAIIAGLNGQELTRPQRNLLSSALNSSAVRDTISELINHRKTTTEQSSPEQRDQEFSETADLPESYERREKAGLAREHGGAVEKVTEALNTAALRSVGKNDFAQVKIDSIKDVSWHKNVGASKWGSKKLCLQFEVEQKSVNRETERVVLFGTNGEVVLQKDGERGRVRFTNAEISKMR